jgi:uncharacterized protein with HEPN domain
MDDTEFVGREFSSPNTVPSKFCAMLERLASQPPHEDRDVIEQHALSAIFLGITAVEAFTNIYSRTIAEEPEFIAHREPIIRSLERRDATGKKLEILGIALGRPIDKTDHRWVAFDQLRELRNRFVHFKTSYDTIQIPGIVMVGLVETSVFKELTTETPANVILCVRGVIELVGQARGVPPEHMHGFIQSQLGLLGRFNPR